MANVDVENIYELVKKLPASDRLRLVEQIVRELSSSTVEESETQRFEWSSIAGSAPGLLEGEDAQSWVSKTRREADERREYAIRAGR